MSQSRRPMGHRRWLRPGAIRAAFVPPLGTSILMGIAARLALIMLTLIMLALVTPPSVAQTVPLPPEEAIAQPVIQPGDSGPLVETLQQKLAQQDLYRGIVDGVYGAETAEAVRSLQRQQGLTVDGLAGVETWQALTSPSGVMPLPAPLLRADLLTLTPLVVAAPPPPPSPLWLALMPLVPITGGLLTYLSQRFQRRQQLRRRRRTQRPLPPNPRPPR